ncbi:hypothetical protein AMECASPLE_005696 [Ameca splendens]|uniref:Uncharacterized protein n=1 Tax=Ameca splendens TaxID=208324 RepID=A0ABV1A6I2_9TELE
MVVGGGCEEQAATMEREEEILMWQRWRRTHSRMIGLRDEDGRRTAGETRPGDVAAGAGEEAGLPRRRLAGEV